ncbi:hypothetical protein [Gluconobacter albidus]|nr:hypothetical protein [Gluconobacter albidus]
MMADARTDYPAQYYARYDTSSPQPSGVTGWFDTWSLSSTQNLPAASAMLPLTQAQWNTRMTGPQGVENGNLVAYTPPAPAIPLKEQAASELSWVATQASLATAMGETFTDAMRVYVKVIQAIASGSDTTSAALPARPTQIMT